MLTLFPFERRFYDEHGIAARYVGHPLADLVPSRSDRDGARSTLGLHRSAPVVALLPGSRLSEVSRLAAPMLRAGSWLRRRRPDIRFVAPLANRETRQCFESVIAGEGANLDVRIVDGHSLTAMAASDVVLLASGTATPGSDARQSSHGHYLSHDGAHLDDRPSDARCG